MENTESTFYLVAFFSGRVQGVGFRYTTRQVAKGYDVTGFVKNLNDGRVELQIEGAEKECRYFIEAVNDELDAFIKKTETSDGNRPRSFTTFSIS